MREQFQLISPKQPIVLGKVGSAYGVRGWLKVFSFTQNTKSIFDYQPWLIRHVGQWKLIELEDWKPHIQSWIIKIQGVDRRDTANLLTHSKIIIDANQLPLLEGDDYYWKDLIGCRLVTTEGYQLGKVINMLETGFNDVMVVKAPLKDMFGMKERLVPFLYGEVVKEVNIFTRVIKVNWEPGF